MKDKIILILVVIACLIVMVVMSIWMYPEWIADLSKPWIDRWDEQMK